MLNEEKIIEKCARNEKKAQKMLYERYAPVLLGICIRYAATRAEAEDILQEAFLKIFLNISDFQGKGAFEAWMRRIVVNTAITHFHQNQKFRYHYDIEDVQERKIENYKVLQNASDFTRQELFDVIKSLPDGYRVVFNLYAIEGYKHKEIAQMLDIDTNTSKSQYSRARKVIQKKLAALKKIPEQH